MDTARAEPQARARIRRTLRAFGIGVGSVIDISGQGTYRAARAHSRPHLTPTCEAQTAGGMCNRPLGRHGYCDRPSDHTQDGS